MAATRRRELCWYCWNEQPDGGHSGACPLAGPVGPLLDQKIREWRRGHNLGYNDSYDRDGNYVFPWQVYNYRTPSFILGYDLGRSEVEKAVLCAVGDDYFEDPDEGHEYVTVYIFR